MIQYTFIGLIIGYIYTLIVLPKKENNYPNIKLTVYPIFYKGNVIIPYKNKAVHIHHWIIYLLIIIINYLFIFNDILYGFAFFLLCHGLTYHDRFNLICKNPYKIS